MEHVLDKIGRTIELFGMFFAPSKCKELLNDGTSVALNSMLDGEELTTLSPFICLGLFLVIDDGTVAEMNTRIIEVRVTYTDLKYLWRRLDILLKLENLCV